MPAVVFEHVSKHFILQHERDRSFQELAVNLVRRLTSRREREDFWALNDASFVVEPGETLGIIGENGSGKSTTLKLVSRILDPTEGYIEVNGRVSALLELGAGFHPDLTGRENVYLNASILGFSRKEIRGKIDSIIEFAELERFIDMPVKHYSSGMFMRLGFSIAIHVDPDILLTDEVLAVGDESFQRKCMDKIAALQRNGKTILFVSHSMEAVRNLCTRVLWLHEGEVRAIGDTRQVVDAYLLFVHEQEAAALAEKHRQALAEQQEKEAAVQEQPEQPEQAEQPERPEQTEAVAETEETPEPTAEQGEEEAEVPVVEETAELPPSNRWGTDDVHLDQVLFLDEAGQEIFMLRSGTAATIEMHYRAEKPVEDPIFGIGIYRQDDVWVYGTNTAVDEQPIEQIEGEGVVRFRMPALHLIEGQYYLIVAVHSREGTPYDYWKHAWEFSVYSPLLDLGVYRPEHEWEFD